jgi:peptide/nickel transport system substrate-binding protein
MTRKLWLSIAGLAVGAGLLVAAGFAGSASSGTDRSSNGVQKKGGTLRFSKSTDIDYVDPALAYFTDSWQLEFATTARLYTYPDKAGAEGATVIPEVAAGFPVVSKDGKTYTIKLKSTYKFQTGAPVNASSFVLAFNRDANPKMQSPATSYMNEFVGASAVIDGKASTISGIKALNATTLQIKTTQPLADLTARLTMPFFSPVLPSTGIEPDGVNNPPGSGPYYVKSRIVNRQIVVARNPFYKGGRPANIDQIVETIGPSLEACRLATEQNSTDYCVDGVPPTAYQDIAKKYGVNKKNGQFFFNGALGTSYFALNHDRPAFKGADGIKLAKAVNYGIDRAALVRAGGFLGGKATDHILPPAMAPSPGLYKKYANPAAAKKVLGGAGPSSLTLYTANRGARVIRAQIFQFNMKQIGIDVNVQQFARAVQHEKTAQRGEPFDVTDEGWLVDYADPITYFDPLLNGANLQATGNSNVSYFNDPTFNAKIAAAKRLAGAARTKAWAAIDTGMMTTNPPWAPFLTITFRDFVSKSLGCYVFQAVFQMDLAVICKK